MGSTLLLLLLLGQGSMHTVLAPGQRVLDVDQPGHIVGTVRDRGTGRPIEHATLVLRPIRVARTRPPPEPWFFRGGGRTEVLARVDADSEGRFRFDGLPYGDYQISVFARGLQFVAGAVLLSEDDPQLEVQVSVPLGGRINGQVVDSGGLPVPGALVRQLGIEGPDGGNLLWDGELARARPVRSDAAGRFELVGVSDGRSWLQASLGERRFSELRAVELPDALPTAEPSELLLVLPGDQEALLLDPDATGGIGVDLEFGRMGPRLRSVAPGGAAEARGLEPGLLLLAMDGEATRFMGRRQVLLKARGAVGSAVSLRLRRGDGDPFELRLIRRVLPPGR